MVTFADAINRKFTDVTKTSSNVGVFLTMVGGLARVNLQGATVEIRCDGWSPPIPGMPVRVETVDGIMRVSGPSRALPPRGEVTDTAALTATVEVDGIEYDLPWVGSYTPVISDTVVIDWASGTILGEQSTAPTTVAPPEIGGGDAPFTDLLIQPAASGKWDNDWNNWWGGAEVWASDNNEGIWVYDRRFGALAGAEITRVEIYLPLISQSGAAFIGLHDHPAIPGGAPSITNLTGLPNRNGWVTLPTEWGNHLRDNTHHGIGVTSGAGYNRWRGVGQDGQSGWLRFAGTR